MFILLGAYKRDIIGHLVQRLHKWGFFYDCGTDNPIKWSKKGKIGKEVK
jgi:hypothetical protein